MKLYKRVMTVTILSALGLLIIACARESRIPENNPVSSPQQTDDLSVRLNSLTKVTTGVSVLWNEWSHDGRYLALDLLGPMHEAGENQAYRTWYFMDALTGDLCSGLQESVKFVQDDMVEDLMWPEESENFFERRAAWVKGNRLLYITSSGNIQYLTPCVEMVENPLSNLPDRIVRISGTNDEGSQIILESDRSYWLYFPETNEINQLDLPPQSDNSSVCFQWSPWEEKVLLTRLEERQHRYWIIIEHLDPQTLIRSNPIEIQATLRPGGYVSDLSYCAGWMGKESYTLREPDGPFWLINAGARPVEKINVLSDLFEQPFHATQGGYYLVVPGTGGKDFHISMAIGFRGEGEFFLYHAENGIVDRMPNDQMNVLLFPNGKIGSTYLDEMEPPYDGKMRLIQVDSAQPKSVVVQEHQSRKHAYMPVDKIPNKQQLLFSSEQGISILDMDSGETVRFWQLDEPELYESFSTTISPDGRTIVGFAHPVNYNWSIASTDIYWLRLEP